MKKKSLKINAILNIIKTGSSIAFPLITFPYVSRILHVTNVGKVNYANSIISYFSLLAALGISIYGIREGAGLRNNKKEFEKFVSEVFSINIISTIIAYLLLIILILVSPGLMNYRSLLIILSLVIPFSTLGIDWINTIYEDYSYITLRTIAFQIISLIIILSLVKYENDYWIYALSMVVSSVGACVMNFVYTKKYCKKKITISLNLKKHLKPILLLFSTNIAAVIYTSIDITLLGIMVGDYSVGLYSTSVKVYNIIKQVIFAIIVVSLPRVSYYFANNFKKEYKETLDKLFDFLILIALPMVTGLFLLSSSIINILAGSEYNGAIESLKILSITIFFATFAYFFMQLILLPSKNEKYILRATTVSAISNVLLNLLFIPFMKQNGAALTTLISEATVLAIVSYYSSQIIELKIDMKNFIDSVIGCIFIGLYVLLIQKYVVNNVVTVVISLVGSLLIYILVLIIVRNKMIIGFIAENKKKILKIAKFIQGELDS